MSMKNIRKVISNKLNGYNYEVANRIDVSRSALLHNFDLLKDITECAMIPVLKANAYGHGIREVAAILKDRTFPYIAVDGYFEALKIREVSKQPVLVMGSTGNTNINAINDSSLAFVVYSNESLLAVCKAKKPVVIHLEINTGMNRHGFEVSELAEVLDVIMKYPQLKLEGMMTHLATSDEIDPEYMEQQYELFKGALKITDEKGITLTYIHAANSAGSCKGRPDFINTVRPGIALYGINTLEKSDTNYNALDQLKPVLELTSAIDQIRNVHQEESVGYNRTYRAKQSRTIATIPIGYYEGIPRSLSNQAFITTNGKLLPTTGTVCMNHTMFDCSEAGLSVGDRVTLISSDKNAPNSIVGLRTTFELFEYGLPTGLNENIRRRIVA